MPEQEKPIDNEGKELNEERLEQTAGGTQPQPDISYESPDSDQRSEGAMTGSITFLDPSLKKEL